MATLNNSRLALVANKQALKVCLIHSLKNQGFKAVTIKYTQIYPLWLILNRVKKRMTIYPCIIAATIRGTRQRSHYFAFSHL